MGFCRRATVAALLLAGSLSSGCGGAPIERRPDSGPAHPLVGEWVGTWENNYNRGNLFFTVIRVAGSRVEGVANIQGSLPYHGFDWPFTGTLEGDRLTGTIPTSPRGPTIYWELSLASDGSMLTGRGLSAPTYAAAIWSKLSLTKRR